MPTYNNGTVHVLDESGKNITDSSTFKNRLAEWKNLPSLLPIFSKIMQTCHISKTVLLPFSTLTLGQTKEQDAI